MKPMIKKTSQFNTIRVSFLFPFKLENKNIADLFILPSLLVKTNKECPNIDLFRRTLIENYIIDINCSLKQIAHQWFLIFTLVIPDKKTLKEDYLEKSLSFFIKTIYEPNVNEKEFEFQIYEKNRQSLINRVNNDLKNVYFYNYHQVINLIDTKGEMKKTLANNKEQLDIISPKTTYDFYEENVLMKKPYVYVVGDVDDKINEYLEKYLPDNCYNYIDNDFNYFLPKISNEVVIKEETQAFFQSCVNYVYNIKNMKKEDAIYLQLVRSILSGGSSDLLMKNLRGEGKLVYHANSSSYSNCGLLIIEAWINKESKEKTKEMIEKTIAQLSEKETIENVLDEIKEAARISLIKAKDSQGIMLSQMIYAESLNVELSNNEKYELLKKINVDDLLDFVKRLELNVIYYLEGEKDAK